MRYPVVLVEPVSMMTEASLGTGKYGGILGNGVKDTAPSWMAATKLAIKTFTIEKRRRAPRRSIKPFCQCSSA